MQIGYCRVSTDEQNLNLQLDAMERADHEREMDDTYDYEARDRAAL